MIYDSIISKSSGPLFLLVKVAGGINGKIVVLYREKARDHIVLLLSSL